MRKEKLFSKDGCYSRVVESNALFHREAIIYGSRIIKALLENHDSTQTIKVLDLACGAEPVSITRMISNFPDRNFDYTGIDINPDQVNFARYQFQFPENIQQINIYEGNAWDPKSCLLQEEYDIIFMGLNLHHGTPEEVYYLATQISTTLSPQGVYINHDVYRPNDQPYQRRPDHHPDNINESFSLLEPALINGIALPDITKNELAWNAPDVKWRLTYSKLLRQSLIEQHAGLECADSTYKHVNMRDYPISLNDFSYIFKKADNDLNIKIIHYGKSHPLLDYIAMPVVSKSRDLLNNF
ncbi:MAG: class I SAM-dependent methyltransferase [Gammaproteobacteria bacterium]|nr:class I SAM-dependent methyltransferase [Gammaproteobacteria bacterium]